MAGIAGCWTLAATATAQVSADALLDKLVAKGILRQDEAEQLKQESLTNTAPGLTNHEGFKFKVGKVIKDMELYGDVRMRYEYRAAQLEPGAGAAYDAADRWRYAVRIGLRGDLADDDFYYGLRLETSQNERSTWNTFGSGGSSPYNGPFSKSSDSIFIGMAYLGWRPTPWLDISVGRVPQPLYTTPMVWDSDYTPEGLVEKFNYSYGPVDYFATLGQFVYQDVTPTSAAAAQGGSSAASFLGNVSDQNAYLLAWQLGLTYHLDTNVSFKVAPVVYTYVGHGNASSGFYGPFVGQGVNGWTFSANGFTPGGVPNGTATASSVPGGFVPGTVISPPLGSASYNQTGINDLAIVELPMELNFKLGRLDAKAFGDFSINLKGDDRARSAYSIGGSTAFPGGVQLNQDQAMQFGLAVGNNLGLVYGTTSRRGTWEARAYWQHVEQYALDPNLLDSDFFEGRGNLQGLYTAFAYSFTDAMIGTVRYGVAQRINDQLGTGGYNADLPLPNPITRYQVMQADLTLRF
ncbi:MAG: putative porin [Verrucomicrobiota bacterium]